MPRALNLLRQDIAYRRAAFDRGLCAAGYDVVTTMAEPQRGDVLVVWNRYGNFHTRACEFEQRGATVLVAENGYLGKDWIGGEWFALSSGHHNGAGWTPYLGPERWESFGVDLAPWHRGTRGPLLLPQRGIGEDGVRMPIDWEAHARQAFPGARIRRHPGLNKNGPTLQEDLHDSSFVVTWGSGAALKALLAGYPVMYDFEKWIGGLAATHVTRSSTPRQIDRLPMFYRLAWAQWRLEEVASGLPFRLLTGITEKP